MNRSYVLFWVLSSMNLFSEHTHYENIMRIVVKMGRNWNEREGKRKSRRRRKRNKEKKIIPTSPNPFSFCWLWKTFSLFSVFFPREREKNEGEKERERRKRKVNQTYLSNDIKAGLGNFFKIYIKNFYGILSFSLSWYFIGFSLSQSQSRKREEKREEKRKEREEKKKEEMEKKGRREKKKQVMNSFKTGNRSLKCNWLEWTEICVNISFLSIYIFVSKDQYRY